MRKAINNSLRIFVISAVLLSAALMFIAYSVQFSLNKINDIKTITTETANCIEKYNDTEAVNILKSMYGESDDMRVTYIYPDGTVAYDNKVNADSMDNHLERPEVVKALEYGEGNDGRHSVTLGEKNYYYAVKLKDGSILRTAHSSEVKFEVFIGFLPALAVILIIIIGLTFPVAKRLTKRIMDPINKIDVNDIGNVEIYDELKPLFDRIADRNKEKEEAEKIRREFTANVSHELKTPLTTISGYAQMINNGMARPEDVREFGKKIEKESERLVTLIDDIINLSNLDERTGIENPERVDLSNITEEAICVLEKAAKEKGIQIFFSKNPTYIMGNATLIGELVYNLLDNAVKYNKEQGKITVFVGETTEGVELSVRDTGIGIPKEDTERIFERFYRVDKSHSKKVGGTGLGLSIVKHVCACHNAQIGVKSIVGKGTTIKVVFPKNIDN